MISEKEMVKLSRILSYALRHNPWNYRLELDEKGLTSVDNLLAALRLPHKNRWYSHIRRLDLEQMIARSYL